MVDPMDYPSDLELATYHQDLDSRIELSCGCYAWQDSAPHDEDDCREAQADWAAEQEEAYRAAHTATIPVEGIAAARMWEAAQPINWRD